MISVTIDGIAREAMSAERLIDVNKSSRSKVQSVKALIALCNERRMIHWSTAI
jgi:hypothetical protein